LLEELLCNSAKQAASRCSSQSSQNKTAFATAQRSHVGKKGTTVMGWADTLVRRTPPGAVCPPPPTPPPTEVTLDTPSSCTGVGTANKGDSTLDGVRLCPPW